MTDRIPPWKRCGIFKCGVVLSQEEISYHKKENLPPVCEKHVSAMRDRIAQCSSLFAKLNLR